MVEFPAQLFRVFMMTTFKQNTGIKPGEKMTEASASACLILDTALANNTDTLCKCFI